MKQDYIGLHIQQYYAAQRAAREEAANASLERQREAKRAEVREAQQHPPVIAIPLTDSDPERARRECQLEVTAQAATKVKAKRARTSPAAKAEASPAAAVCHPETNTRKARKPRNEWHQVQAVTA